MLPSEAKNSPGTKFPDEFLYEGVPESFEITRRTVDAKPLLYLVFAI